MGQKVNPVGLRLGINRTWDSRWFANTGEYGKLLHEDMKIREYVKSKLQAAGISQVEIERAAARMKVNIYSAKPGLVIGKKGKDIDELSLEELEAATAPDPSREAGPVQAAPAVPGQAKPAPADSSQLDIF